MENRKMMWGGIAAACALILIVVVGVRKKPGGDSSGGSVPSGGPSTGTLTLDEAQYQSPTGGADSPVLDTTAADAAQAFRKGNEVVLPSDDTTVIAEAEEFHITPGAKNGWKALPWGANYYASTFANTFMSRKAFLGAPEQADNAVASIDVQVPKAGRYLALVRYEAPVNFQTQFKLKVEQGGSTKLDRLYGSRDNTRIWAFKKGLVKEVSWDWGAVENVVWEGHDAYVDLAAGTAHLTLTAGQQPKPGARRNIDLVMLTSDEAQVKDRIAKENYLPLDGMLTQAGDVYLKVHNTAAAPLTLTVPPCIEHSPYAVHMRNWKKLPILVQPGQTTEWTEVGSLLDTMNDGQWAFEAAKGSTYDLEFGVRGADGNTKSVRSFSGLVDSNTFTYRGNMRYIPKIGTPVEVLHELVTYLKSQKVAGKAPTRTLVYGLTFDAAPTGVPASALPGYQADLNEFIQLMGGTAFNQSADAEFVNGSSLARGYVELRAMAEPKLKEYLAKLQSTGVADKIAVASMGDEITLAAPPATDQAGFHAWLQGQKLSANDVDAASGGDWNKVTYNDKKETAKSNPALFYYSTMYGHYFGIQALKNKTDIVRAALPHVGVGANYSPHHDAPYIGLVHQWVTAFREGGLTMPWSEDYAWQLPIGSQQMSLIDVDMLRAAVRDKPDAKIHMYVTAHFPGNTPNSWRRNFYGALGHGAKIINLFEIRPAQAAYTENYVDLPSMYQEVRKGIYELGQFEDIVQDGQVRAGQAALWFSETGDAWDNNRHPFDAAKRTLYVAIRGQQLPLDFVVEQDALAGSLKGYKILYLTDPNVSRAATTAIAAWVAAGGKLFATAGAGQFDELNRPNTAMRELLGADEQSLSEGNEPVRWVKQDLPFAAAIDKVTLKTAKGTTAIPAFGARSHFTAKGAKVQGTFGDGSPAVVGRQVGSGSTTYCGFMPGLSYFKPAIPARPADRGSTDAAFDHFIPSKFDRAAGALIGAPAGSLPRAVLASNPLVDSTIIESKAGTLIPLTNWSGGVLKGMTLKVGITTPSNATLASGRPVKTTKKGQETTYTFDLDVADALILR